MKYIKLFEDLIVNQELIDYIKKFDIQKIKLPFSKNKYESFIHNLSPDRYDEMLFLI